MAFKEINLAPYLSSRVKNIYLHNKEIYVEENAQEGNPKWEQNDSPSGNRGGISPSRTPTRDVNDVISKPKRDKVVSFFRVAPDYLSSPRKVGTVGTNPKIKDSAQVLPPPICDPNGTSEAASIGATASRTAGSVPREEAAKLISHCFGMCIPLRKLNGELIVGAPGIAVPPELAAALETYRDDIVELLTLQRSNLAQADSYKDSEFPCDSAYLNTERVIIASCATGAHTEDEIADRWIDIANVVRNQRRPHDDI